MLTLLSLIAIALFIYGCYLIFFRGELVLGLVCFVAAAAIGPGGWSILSAAYIPGLVKYIC